MKKSIILMLVLALPVVAFALDKRMVEEKVGIKIKESGPSPIPGLFEMVTDDNQIFYVDESVTYIISGSIVDVNTRANLTQQKIDRLSRVDFSSLPLQNAIKTGTGKKKIAVFHDPDCPYCRKLYKELEKIDDVEIYSFVFYLPMHPKAYDKAKKVYCADDKLKALDEVMRGNNLDHIKLCKTDIVDKNSALAKKIGVRGTPHMVLEDGSTIRGFRPAEYIRNRLKKI